MLKKSTVFNFLYIFQLIQKVLTSNFLNLVLNIHICLYKNSKILFLLEKNNFQVKISTFFLSQTPKSKAIFEIFVPSCPKSARNKVYQINLNFSKIQSAAMSVDVSLRSKKRITVQCTVQSHLKALEIRYALMDCYLVDIYWLKKLLEGAKFETLTSNIRWRHNICQFEERWEILNELVSKITLTSLIK